jgi:hypothetical protein
MNVFIIYKQIFDEEGEIFKLELVEVDKDEAMAMRYVKLYNNMISLDLRQKLQYAYLGIRVS